MIRFSLILTISLVLGLQAYASVKLKNSSSSGTLNTNMDISSDSILMSENFENINDLKVSDYDGNWSIEKQDNGNSVYCNKVKNGWTEFSFGKKNWRNYSMSFRIKFTTDKGGRLETHIRKNSNRQGEYSSIINNVTGDTFLDYVKGADRINRRLVNGAKAPIKDKWANIQLIALGNNISYLVNGKIVASTKDDKIKKGAAMIAVSANSKVCVDDLVAINLDEDVDVGDTKSFYSHLLDGHDYDNIQKQIATQIIQNLGNRKKDLVIYEGGLFQPPRSLKKQMSDASLEYYYLIQDARRKARPNEYYMVQASENYEEFEISNKSHKKIDEQMKKGTIFSYLYYANDKMVYDVLPPKKRFNMALNEESHFASHSMGKSVTSYLLGHAICEGYIGSPDEIINDWPLMESSLYFDQPLIRLLNMSAGDTNVIKKKSGSFTKTGANIHNQPLIVSTQNEDELKNTKPISNASYSYSNLTSDVLFNYVAHRVGEDFDKFLAQFYQQKIGIKYPVYLSLNKLRFGAEVSINNLTAQGAWQYGIHATRYDYLRIAKAILNDWKNDTCEGKYLKDLYQRAVPTGNTRNWNTSPGKSYRYFGSVSQRYAGQFQTGFYGLHNKKVLGMIGADGQQIIINLDDSRIIVISAGQEGWYNTKSIAYDLIKSGKMKSGNWN